ncbi:MAG: hypothetical protein Kow0076_3140 [Francisella sp.]
MKLSEEFFNPWLEGALLAAVLSAIMSTSSALLLSLSSAFAVDVYAKFIRKKANHRELLNVSRLILFLVTVVAIILSYDPNSKIIKLVGFAWAGIGCSFGAVIIFSLFWSRMNRSGAIAGILSGALTVLIWPVFQSLGGLFKIYAMVPGFVVSSICIVVFSLLTSEPEESVKLQYKKYKELL